MVHSSTESPLGDARNHVSSTHALRDTAEHGVYTALLAAAGLIIVGLLRVTERFDDR